MLQDVLQFLSYEFPFGAMQTSSRMQSRHFVAWNIHTVIFPILWHLHNTQCWRFLLFLIFFTHMFISCFWYNTLYLPINFLAIVSICQGSLFSHFKNGPEYLTRETVRGFISLMRFLPFGFISRNLLVRRKYSFYFFFHLPLFDDARFQKSQVFVVLFLSKHLYTFLIYKFSFFHWFSLPNYVYYYLCESPGLFSVF